MTVYPFAIDDDTTIIRVDDNITEVGGQAINECRSAIFAIEDELGTNPSGSLDSVSDRLSVALNANGTIKTSALTSVGLATLPIANIHVGSNAGIEESKLALDYSTVDLYTLINANTALLNSMSAYLLSTATDLTSHIRGVATLSDGTSPGRHVASHIDINAIPVDTRDLSYVWTGLFNSAGVQRPATQVASALLEINDDLNSHKNATGNAHVATAVSVNTNNFGEIPQTVENVQEALDALDDMEVSNLGNHRATQHANCVPTIARAQSPILPDGYRENVVPSTEAITFLVRAPNTMPVDNISNGDDLVAFNPVNTSFVFDSQFSQVRIGDIIRINYGNGVEAAYPIDSIRFTPGVEWVVRLNGVNLYDSDGYKAYARIDRPSYDVDTAGVLACAAANSIPAASFSGLMPSLIVGNPRGAMAIGLGFDANQLDETHYNLYLHLYPSGNPTDRIINLPAIDVTGNVGTTPGNYTLESVVQETNNALRAIGYNYRFIAFAHNGEFGIMLADAINNAAFSIIAGVNSGGTLSVGPYTDNVIGQAAGGTFDAFGFGTAHADVAGPAYLATYGDTVAALLPAKVIVPLQHRYYIANGQRRDTFAATYNANSDGYWDGYISARTPVGAFTVETTYTVYLDLKAAGLKPGMTLVVQPAISFSDPAYFDVDYGRFIIKEVSCLAGCPGVSPDSTMITVINGIHATGAAFGFSSNPPLQVRLYFSEDSVSFNKEHVINTIPTPDDYRRLHEIYISDTGNTFSHERGRMPVQVEEFSPPHLRTDLWHIIDVSAKLRGYRDSLITFNKYVRFYIINYDTTSGEYDGYIGQRNPTGFGALNIGPITRGRKDVTTRFYDETYIDYIDLRFQDTATSGPTGDDVLSDGYAGGGGTPRFVDIEIFSTMKTDDEFLLLATCEVNWHRIPGQDRVEHVVDRRQFGSIDETDFTDSAKEYISAGDRYLHANGVIRGLTFDYISTLDNREIFFKGGVALVNGTIATVNNQSVTIPEVFPQGTPTPTTVDWIICVNEQNNLEPIVLTATKMQFFAESNVSGTVYYIPSVTYSELLTTRKDLTPIAIVTATIASVTITDGDITDIRNFVASATSNPPLVLSTSELTGNFYSFEAAKAWVNYFGDRGGTNLIYVRGNWTIDTTVDLSGMNYPTEFVGDGATLTVTAWNGFTVDTNITLRNLNFIYAPATSTVTLQPTDRISCTYGCIRQASGSDIEDVKIIDCTFSASLDVGEQRPPFISFERNNGDVINRLTIENNTFTDTDVLDVKYLAAIAIVSTNDSIITFEPAIIINSRISRNKCNAKQGIYITIQSSVDPVIDPGMVAINTVISENTCGTIGFLTNMVNSTNVLVTAADRTMGLSIRHNTCNLIGQIINMVSLGTVTTTVPDTDSLDVPTGAFSINNNFCSWIFVLNTAQSLVITDGYGQLSITDNSLSAFDTEQLIKFGFSGGMFASVAIFAAHNRDYDLNNVIISRNTIVRGWYGAATYYYDCCIYCAGSAIITSNSICGIAQNGYGIVATAANSIGQDRIFIINGNSINREGMPITNYIYLGTAEISGLCVDNAFDTFTVDGSSTACINTDRNEDIVTERNKNQTETTIITGTKGTFTITAAGAADATIHTIGGPAVLSFVCAGAGQVLHAAFRLSYADAASLISARWMLQLDDCIPKNTRLVGIDVTHSISVVPAAVNIINITIASPSTPAIDETTGNIAMAVLPAVTTTLGAPMTNDWVARPGVDYYISIFLSINGAAPVIADVLPLQITYRW